MHRSLKIRLYLMMLYLWWGQYHLDIFCSLACTMEYAVILTTSGLTMYTKAIRPQASGLNFEPFIPDPRKALPFGLIITT
jgi:hypothetical protein